MMCCVDVGTNENRLEFSLASRIIIDAIGFWWVKSRNMLRLFLHLIECAKNYRGIWAQQHKPSTSCMKTEKNWCHTIGKKETRFSCTIKSFIMSFDCILYIWQIIQFDNNEYFVEVRKTTKWRGQKITTTTKNGIKMEMRRRAFIIYSVFGLMLNGEQYQFVVSIWLYV